MEHLMSRIMTRDEALDWKARISDMANALRLLLFEGYERRAWDALGYATWTDCLKALAEEYHFSERRLWQLHAANQAEQRLNNCSVGEIREGTLRPLTALPPDEQLEVWQEAVQHAPHGKPTAQLVQAVVEQRHFRVQCSGETEWYTPAMYIEAARQVMGAIDLDPATSLEAQATIQATRFYTVDDDGLAHPWLASRVWLNPPYQQPVMEQFVRKLTEEITAGHVSEAILLSHNFTDTGWFHYVCTFAQTICFTKGRIRFIRADGHQDSPTNGQAFFYFGPHRDRFAKVFRPFGCIMQPDTN